MMVILTSASASPCAAASPPKPAPTMTTWWGAGLLGNVVSRGDPGIESAEQGAHALETVIHQNLGDAGGRGFARTGAVQNNIPIARYFLEAVRHVLQRNMQRPRNPTRLECTRGGRAHIDDHGRGAGLDER